MSWYSFRPYVTAAERRRRAAHVARKMTKGGRQLAPVEISGCAIATTFWGAAWCDNLESYSDFENRLPRGRTYVRNGSVIDLQIESGKVTALVQGSDLYKVSITLRALAPARWKQFTAGAAGKVTNLLDLLQGRLGKDVLSDITARERGLFPAPKEITLDCSCPDWADMCKHVAAVLYGVGARLDVQPELFFTLRGVDMQELITAASTTAANPIGETDAAALAGADLSEIFGVEIDSSARPPAPAKKPTPRKRVQAATARKAPANSGKETAADRWKRKKKPASKATTRRRRKLPVS